MKVALLLSGGVDSSVALQLLKNEGHDVTAFYLKIWLEDETSFLGSCPWEEDLLYVRATCTQLGVPLEIVPMQQAYHDTVVDYTIREIKAGRTPNPDIFCNSQVKFGFFLDKIDHSFEKVATGHYAQVIHQADSTQLLRSPDPIKDQTYFLAYLKQHQLKRALLPIGHLTKAEVRQLATRFDLPTKQRKDSQGICFLGKLKFHDFIKHYLGEKPGPMVEFETGKKLGTHRGFWFHTIGQRQGSGLAGGPWYVVHKNIEQNCVFVSRQYHEQHLVRTECFISACNWIPDQPQKTDLQVKLRHGPHLHTCKLTPVDNKRMRLHLAQNDQGIAPGQFAVLYDGLRCVGAGVIEPQLPGQHSQSSGDTR